MSKTGGAIDALLEELRVQLDSVADIKRKVSTLLGGIIVFGRAGDDEGKRVRII